MLFLRAVHWRFEDLEAGPRTALHCAAQSGHLEVWWVGFEKEMPSCLDSHNKWVMSRKFEK